MASTHRLSTPIRFFSSSFLPLMGILPFTSWSRTTYTYPCPCAVSVCGTDLISMYKNPLWYYTTAAVSCSTLFIYFILYFRYNSFSTYWVASVHSMLFILIRKFCIHRLLSARSATANRAVCTNVNHGLR